MNVQQILSGAQDALTTRRVFGEPVEVNGVTIIPAAAIRGGGGGGGRDNERGGVGFGLQARPAGAYVVKDGDVQWRPAVDVNKIVLGGQIVAIAALVTFRPLIRRWAERGGRRADRENAR